MRSLYLLLTLVIVTQSCGAGKSKENKDELMNKADYVVEKNPVDTIILRKQQFKKQLNSNGKLKSVEKCDLKFKVSGSLSELPVANGMSVSKGDVIARLNTEDVQFKLERAKMSKEKALLDLKDYLIGQGYKIDSLSIVPKDVMRIAEIRSGYTTVLADISQAEYELENSVIYAPFSGKIANLNLKVNEYPGDILCTLINDNEFDVDFAVLETEIDAVKVGGVVRVMPFNNKESVVMGRITEINPMIDEKGQIKVKAKISNNREMMDGMNVKIYIEESVSNQLVVPKSAVVIRDNLEVLFRMSPEGKAMWTYVNIVMSNSDSYVVVPNVSRSAELNEGDAIVVVGNLNLADGSDIEVASRNK